MFKLPVLVGFGCRTNPVSATLVFYINFLYQSTVFNSVPVRHQWHCQAYTLYSLMFCTNMLMNFSLYPGPGDEKAEEEETRRRREEAEERLRLADQERRRRQEEEERLPMIAPRYLAERSGLNPVPTTGRSPIQL